jgi:L-ascorbate metabolism protein UlaG (beta-lactamase superfamily)
MHEPRLYLKQNVQCEPLFNQWYAWTHLIAPHTAAMFIANLHLKIMKSYVAAPQIHANAVKNPAMLGGPFIDYQGGRVPEIKALMERTTKQSARMIEFAESVKALDEMLKSEARGYSLEPLYQKIPRNLRGYVELVYDLNDNPSIRFLEGLLYHSSYYETDSQSILLSLINQDERAFALSTPRLPDDKSLQVMIPFVDEAVDELFKMKQIPRTFSYIKERLRVKDEQEQLFRSFFTDEEPVEPPKYEGEGVRIRYFGHACVLLETKEISILIDPALSYRYENGIERYTYSDLPEVIDYVLITHSHQDHVMFETLLQLRHKIKTLVVPRSHGGNLEDPSTKLVLKNIGFKNVIEIEEMETIDVLGGSIRGLPFFGEHCDLNIGTKIAHLIRLKDKSFLLAADSNNIEPDLYQHLFELVGEINVLFLGMECDGAPMSWLYGPLLTRPLERKMDQSRRFSGSDYEKCRGIVKRFNCQEVYVYALGQEPWLTYALSLKYTEQSNPIIHSNRLIADCRSRGIVSERLFGIKELFYCEQVETLNALDCQSEMSQIKMNQSEMMYVL